MRGRENENGLVAAQRDEAKPHQEGALMEHEQSTATIAIERTLRVTVPDGCRLPGVSFGTDSRDVLARIAAEHPDARHLPGEYVAWRENTVSVVVSYVGADR